MDAYIEPLPLSQVKERLREEQRLRSETDGRILQINEVIKLLRQWKVMSFEETLEEYLTRELDTSKMRLRRMRNQHDTNASELVSLLKAKTFT